ncbi:hypothetical protein ACFQ1S_06365, partial [Kibdelosporangium lantanae]
SAAAHAAADRSVQSLIGTVTVFDASAHRTASAHVIRHLTSPVTDRTFYGGLLVSAKKLRFGHFHTGQLHGLLPVLVDVLSSVRDAPNEALLAASLLAMVPPAHTPRLSTRMRAAIASLRARLAVPDPAVDRICTAVSSEFAAFGQDIVDPLFPALVRELLHDPVFDMRLYTCFLIDATPFRAPLSRALGQELTRSVRSGAVDRSVILLEALRVLGGSDQRRQIERLLSTPRLPLPVANSAAYALGHIRGRTTDQEWRLLIARFRDRTSPADISIMDRVVYALGMSNRLDLIQSIEVDPVVARSVRLAARWWIDLPQHLIASART